MSPAKAGWEFLCAVYPRFRFAPPGATDMPLLRSWDDNDPGWNGSTRWEDWYKLVRW